MSVRGLLGRVTVAALVLVLGGTCWGQQGEGGVQLKRDKGGFGAQFPRELADFVGADWRAKAAALERLVRDGKRSVPTLVAGLRTAYAKTRVYRPNVNQRDVGRHCAIALARINDRSACEALVECLDFPDREARREIVRALGALRCRDAIPGLVTVLADPREDKVNQREAALALAGFGGEGAEALAAAKTARDEDQLATEALVLIALEDRAAVERLLTDDRPRARERAKAALAELDRRRKEWPTLPSVREVEAEARGLRGARKFAEALALWERVVDSGLYNLRDAEMARENMLEIKNEAGAGLYGAPVAVWRNKVYILAAYDADLVGRDGQVVKHVKYALSDREIEYNRQRLRDLEEAVRVGSCGALKLVNDVEVVWEPWKVFRPSIRTTRPEQAGHWRISRQDLASAFNVEELCGDQGYHCVVFQVRGEPGAFVIDSGSAGGRMIMNTQNERFENADVTVACHEWLHMLHAAVWQEGHFGWTQCIPLHDQIRDLQLQRAWRLGEFAPQREVHVDCMRRYVTLKMWKSVAKLEAEESPDAEEP